MFPISVHTTGTVQILEAQADASVAIIIHACDGVIEGDYLEKFEMPKMSSNETGTTADFARPAHLILGDDRRQIASPGQFMVLDRGSDHGVRPGQKLRFSEPRSKARDRSPRSARQRCTVRAQTSVVKIESSVDAIYVGDLVAIHR